MVDRSEIRVLVIDDENTIRESLVEFLEDYDFQMFSAESAEDALELLGREQCDVAIVDLRLPGRGSDVLIRNAHEMDSEIRFLIHTGSVDYQISNEYRSMGIRPEHVFSKPMMDLSPMAQAIEDLVAERAAEKHE